MANLTFKATVALCIISLLSVLALGFLIIDFRENIQKSSNKTARLAAAEAAKGIETSMAGFEGIAQEIAKTFTEQQLTKIQVKNQLLCNLTNANNGKQGTAVRVSAITALYVPGKVPLGVRPAKDEPKDCDDVTLSGFENKPEHEPKDCIEPQPKSGKSYVGFAMQTDGNPEYFVLEEYGYDLESQEIDQKWYVKPMECSRPIWSQTPYPGSETKIWWAGGYGVPFYSSPAREEVAGLIAVDVTLDRIREVVSEIILEKLEKYPREASYAFIFSETGDFISHPNRRYIEESKKLSNFNDSVNEAIFNEYLLEYKKIKTPSDPSIAELESLKEELDRIQRPEGVLQVLPNGSLLLEDHKVTLSGQSSWVFFAPISETGWWVGIVLDKNEVFRTSGTINTLRLLTIGLVMAALAFLFFLSVLLFRAYGGAEANLWAVSITLSVLCIAGLAFLWVQVIKADPNTNPQNILLINDAIPPKVQLEYALNSESATPKDLISIPTGVFVQSLEFSSANNVSVTGLIWQRYSLGDRGDGYLKVPDKDTPGFILPESDSTEVSEAFRKYNCRNTDGDDEACEVVVGWNFKAELRQEFDYSKYPFDREDVWIRIWHSNFGEGIILTPDFASYKEINPAKLPGLEEKANFVIEGWDITRSFFTYRRNSYNVDFGINEIRGQTRFPELYFNIGLQRNFINAIVSNLVPLLFVAVLLFAVLFTIRSKSEENAAFGFSASTVLGFCAALFFVVILAHISLRSGLSAKGLVYLEALYFTIYLLILGIAVNSLLISYSGKFGIIRYRDNLIPRLLYWPFFFGFLLFVTLIVFSF